MKQGDVIGLTAPGYHLEPCRWESIVPLLQSWGLRVQFGRTLHLQDRVFAGTDRQRLDDFDSMMCDPQIKAVLCVRGGYGCNRLLPDLDKRAQDFTPKWLIGYSDVTALLSYLVDKLYWQCIHGPMPVDFPLEPNENNIQSWDYLRKILFGEMREYTIPAHELNRSGKVSAALVGGNLSVLYGLNATPYQLHTDNRILFIEEVGENLHHLDRMMWNLRMGGRLERLKGLVVGAMTGMKDGNPSFGKTACEIIYEHVAGYDYPLVFGFPAGHEEANFPLVLGAETHINVSSHDAVVKFAE